METQKKNMLNILEIGDKKYIMERKSNILYIVNPNNLQIINHKWNLYTTIVYVKEVIQKQIEFCQTAA